ncbi:MAG TPA: tetratricopeptide repeat protein, partial [Micromonosporaceae bacterium]|nr:tetratricopeptide repeat protein [Micromonosporaceae bacterium]
RDDEASATARHTAMGQALGAWLTVFDAMEARLVREARGYHGARRSPGGAGTSYPLGWMPAQRSVLSGATEQTASAILSTGWSVTATLVSMSFELWSQWDNWPMTRAVARYSARRAGDRLIPDTWELIAGRERPWDEPTAALEACVTTFQRLDELTWHAVAKVSLGNLYRAGGHVERARRTLRDCVDRCHALGQRDWEAVAWFSLGSLSAADGDLCAAVDSFGVCMEIFGDRADVLWQAYSRRALGYAYQQHGRFAEAVVELSAALPVFRAHEDIMWEAHTMLTLGLAHLGLRRGRLAADHLETCVRTFRRYGDPRSEAIALRALAHAEADRGHTATAETHLRESLAVFGRLENTVGVPLLLSDLGALCERTGRIDEATAYREGAREILARLDLTGVLDLAAGRR